MRCLWFVLCLTLLAGCASQRSDVTVQEVPFHRPSVDAVRAEFAEATSHDPELKLGFFSAPWIDDFAPRSIGVEARSSP